MPDADSTTRMCVMGLFVSHGIPACNGCNAIAEPSGSGMVNVLVNLACD